MSQARYKKIHDEILKKIRPTKTIQNKLSKTVNKLIEKTNQAIFDLRLTYAPEPILVGSVAKNTYLQNPDIDIFVQFPNSISIDELRRLGLAIGYTVLPDGEERYAEHPYILGTFNGFETDLVPCYKLKSIAERMTAVDRTPFHTEFIIQHLKPAQFDEVRLLKQFIKGIGAYGAEIEVLGFSGYLCELLILKYRTFLNLLENANNWPSGLVLTVGVGDKKYNSKNDTHQTKSVLSNELNRKFRDDPLVFIDPVDSNRNVASALSLKNFELFKKAAGSYLHEPKFEFFFPNAIKPMSRKQLKDKINSRSGALISIAFDTPDVVPDILHGQLRKCQRAIQKLLDTAGFGTINTEYFVNHQTIMLFELKRIKLSEIETHMGPPDGHENVKDFREKWNTSPQAVSKPYKKDKRWYVDIKREFTSPIKLIKSKINTLNVGKHITHAITEKLDIYEGVEVIQNGYEKHLTKFLNRKYPWEF